MPLEVFKGTREGFKTALPKHLQQVALRHLRLRCDYANRSFQGAVVFSYPLTRLGNGKAFFKMVLQESEDSCSRTDTINMLVFGKLAEDCEKVVHQGDAMAVAGFSLTKSASEDGRHCCQLEVSDETGSTIYICLKSPCTAAALETVAMSVAPKYTYIPLNLLKSGTVVNFYGAVKFFKPPYLSKGTDYCSVVTVVDQSNAKLVCMLFNANRDALPKIYKNGDIVRFHRIKVREFNGQRQGVTSSGFAALSFDGTVGAPVIPRATSKSFTFTDEDKKAVEDLRIWMARNSSNSVPAVNLSTVHPQMFFDLTCQLVGKAKVDGSSYLLKVWDGTRSPFLSWKVLVREEDLEGDRILIDKLKNLTVDVTVYDNHVQIAKSLKVGNFIRLYSLHAKTPNPEGQPYVSCIQFHLHGGTGYGRGITVLPESHTDVKELKEFLDSLDLEECAGSGNPSSDPRGTYLNLGSCLEGYQQLPVTVLTVNQHFDVATLNTVLNSRIPQQYRIRAKLRRFEPKKLHQSVKLLCPQCNMLQEVPDVNNLNVLLQTSATRPNPCLQNIPFCESVVWDVENQGRRYVTVHFVTHSGLLQEPADSLIMIEGGTLAEILRLSKKFKGIIPVRSIEDKLVLLDLSVPFFWQGNIQYYGCQRCSDPKAVSSLYSLAAQQNASWEPNAIAEALGIVLLQYVFVMKFTLDDGTGALDAYLVDTEMFFQISASEVLTSNIFQENMEKSMNKLCPTGRNPDDLPWLECFIKSYYVKDGQEQQLFYQISDTTVAEDIS